MTVVDLSARRLHLGDLRCAARLAACEIEAAYRGAMVSTFAPLDHAGAVREARMLLQAISLRWREAFSA